MTTPNEFLIDGILPCNEIHLLAGSSGSGKTTWLFQMLAEWQEGLPVLGHTSYPVPYTYLSVDRSSTSVKRTLQRLGLQDKINRMVCREHLPIGLTVATAIEVALKSFPDSKVFFIEGFQTLAGDRGNSYTPVAALLSATTAYCAKEGLTIIGVCHSPKMKMDEKFQHSREVVLGSVAWAAFSDTVITMDQAEDTGIITVRVMPRNAAKEDFQFRFGLNGVLVPVIATGGKADLELYIYSLASGSTISRQDILQTGHALNIASRTAERVITEALSDGVLEVASRGVYRRLPEVLLN